MVACRVVARYRLLATGFSYYWAHDCCELIYYFTAFLHVIPLHSIHAFCIAMHHSCILSFCVRLKSRSPSGWLLVVCARAIGTFAAVDRFRDGDKGEEEENEEDGCSLRDRSHIGSYLVIFVGAEDVLADEFCM